MSRRLIRVVVDADVARAAGESRNPVASACLRALTTVRESTLEVAFGLTLMEEWNRHRSPQSRLWLGAMYSRKRVHRCLDAENASLRKRLDDLTLPKATRSGIAKDMHLIELASAVDGFILSMDSTMRERLGRYCRDWPEISKLVWFNPAQELDEFERWVNDGCRFRKAHMLAAKAKRVAP